MEVDMAMAWQKSTAHSWAQDPKTYLVPNSGRSQHYGTLRVAELWETQGKLCGPGGGLPQVGGHLLRPDGLLLLSAHVLLYTAVGKDMGKKDPRRLSLRMSMGPKNCASRRISVGHLIYIFITLTFRESSSEFVRVSDLSTLHTNPAPGTRAGPGEGVCRNSSFYPAIWWAEG